MSIIYLRAVETGSIPAGQGRSVHLQGRFFAVYNVEGEICVLDDACPHRGASLGAGALEGNQLICPLHGWAFNPRTGECRSNPHRPVRRYPVRIRQGWIEIGVAGSEESQQTGS